MDFQTHASLVEVHRVGVLVVGESGVEKSECALELVQRGHKLVADDVVRFEICRTDSSVWKSGGKGSNTNALGLNAPPRKFWAWRSPC